MNLRTLCITAIVTGALSVLPQAYGHSYESGHSAFGAQSNVAAPHIHSNFVDVPHHYWAYGAISLVTQEKLMSGYQDGSFRPDRSLTREEAASLFSRLIGESPTTTSTTFQDISPERWSAQAIESVASQNLISGYGDNSYRPDKPMSRQEFALVTYKFIHSRGYRTEDPTVLDNVNFGDQKFIAPWAQTAVRELASLGFLSYDPRNLFNPEKYITRAEAAEITYRLLFSKEALAFDSLLFQQKIEGEARQLLQKAFGSEEIRDKGAMFWRDGKLVIAMKSVNDLKALGAQLAFLSDKSFANHMIITNGSYTLADFDNLQVDGAYLYNQLEPNGTIVDVKPTPNVDGLTFTVTDLQPATSKAFSKKFGKKLRLQQKQF